MLLGTLQVFAWMLSALVLFAVKPPVQATCVHCVQFALTVVLLSCHVCGAHAQRKCSLPVYSIRRLHLECYNVATQS